MDRNALVRFGSKPLPTYVAHHPTKQGSSDASDPRSIIGQKPYADDRGGAIHAMTLREEPARPTPSAGRFFFQPAQSL
jgi:hypothetical protein